MQKSPYTPGTTAREVPGRGQQLAEIQRNLEYLATLEELAGRIELYVGPRGVGKTSLLRAAERAAHRLGIETLWVTAGDQPLVDALTEALHELAEHWTDEVKASFLQFIKTIRVSTSGVSVGGIRDNATQQATAQNARALQMVLLRAHDSVLKSGKKGLVVFIDEIQAADKAGLRSFAYTWQHLQTEESQRSMMTIAAGLSHSQDVITDAVSFAERFRYHHLGNLAPKDAALALKNPALRLGVQWDSDTRAGALELANGYPYFIQIIGDEIWHAAGDPEPGTVLDSEALKRAKQVFKEIQSDLFRARWGKTTERESAMLVAMASIGDGTIKRGDIAQAMGTSSRAISMLRRSLMDKGLIDSPGHGLLEFSVPGFAAFVREEKGIER